MYATAHRVVSLRGQEAINAFLHLHGDSLSWPSEPWRLPETEPGTPVWESVQVRPGGNRIRSYLDVLTPDDTRPAEIEAALTGLWVELRADQSSAGGLAPLPNPVVYRRGNVVLRYWVEDAEQGRAAEFEALRSRVEDALEHRYEAVVSG